MFNFDLPVLSTDEYMTVIRISRRAVDLGLYQTRIHAEMDLCAAMSHCPLDLPRLLDFPDFDFRHDMGGIRAKLDRTTGRLTDLFNPRCSLPVAQALDAARRWSIAHQMEGGAE